MAPIGELRVGIPYGYHAGINIWLALVICVLANCIPVPFIISLIRMIFDWIKKRIPFLRRLVEKIEKKGENKAEKVKKRKKLGLFLLVAIPLPGTGAWTGSLAAALLNMRIKDAFPMIALGVLTAGLIMTGGTLLFGEVVLKWLGSSLF